MKKPKLYTSQRDCAVKDDMKYMREKEEYMNISTIMLFKLFDSTHCIKLFSLFCLFCTACTSIGCSFLQVSHLSTFH